MLVSVLVLFILPGGVSKQISVRSQLFLVLGLGVLFILGVVGAQPVIETINNLRLFFTFSLLTLCLYIIL